MNVIDKVLDDYWKVLPEENRFMMSGSLFEAEKAVLNLIAPKNYGRDEVLSFVFYHLHGEELPKDFFVRRHDWLEKCKERSKGD